MPVRVIPRSDWTTFRPNYSSRISFKGTGWVQHHTVTNTIEPEPEPEPLEVPRVAHLGILGAYRFKPGWATKAKLKRRYAEPHKPRGGAHAGETVPGISKWNQMEIRRAGDGRYVVVQINAKRIAQLKAKAKAARVVKTAAFLRVRGLERSALRAMESYHRSLGWTAIGYHLIAFPSGRVYAGRTEVDSAGNPGAMFYGSHCPGWNSLPSISAAGTYTKGFPKRLRASIVALLVANRADWYRGHREKPYGTSCPGVTSAELDAIARDAGARR